MLELQLHTERFGLLQQLQRFHDCLDKSYRMYKHVHVTSPGLQGNQDLVKKRLPPAGVKKLNANKNKSSANKITKREPRSKDDVALASFRACWRCKRYKKKVSIRKKHGLKLNANSSSATTRRFVMLV